MAVMATQENPSPAQSFLARKHGLLIGGTWIESQSATRLPVINPATGGTISSIANATESDVDAAVAAARRAFAQPSWADMKPSDRGRLLWRIADLLEANGDELAELEFLDNGKSPVIARKGDVAGAADVFRYYAGWCTKIFGRTMTLSRPGTQHAYTVKEPAGVVGLIVPWNFPLLMAAWKLAPALAAGCCCILKPAEETSLTALRLGELLLEAGLPAGVVNVVTGLGHVAGAAIAAHADVDKVAFTGSTEVGKRIVQAASGNLKKLSLELGGKSPTIVLADADPQQAIAAASAGIFFNAGQVCAAGSRLYVQRKLFDAVLDGVEAHARAIKLGAGDEPGAQMGPLISARQRDRVANYVRDGLEQGAQARVGGDAVERAGWFFQPTVLVGTRPDMRVVQEESSARCWSPNRSTISTRRCGLPTVPCTG